MKINKITIMGLVGAVVPSIALAQLQVDPAPAGEPTMVAQRIITYNEHPCPLVVSATRLGDGSIRARCNNGEVYRVAVMKGIEIAMRCSAAEKMGIKGC